MFFILIIQSYKVMDMYGGVCFENEFYDLLVLSYIPMLANMFKTYQ